MQQFNTDGQYVIRWNYNYNIKTQNSDKLNNVIKLSYVEQLSTDNDEFIFVVDCNNDRDLQQSMHTRNSLKCAEMWPAI